MNYLFRLGARTVDVLFVLTVLAVAGAGQAHAHPTLLATDPASDTAVTDSPQTIRLIFNEAVTIGPGAVVLLDKDGRQMPIGAAETAHNGQAITARLSAPLPPGSYTVRWRATGTDGDQVEEEFRFGVGYALTARSSGVGGSSTSWPDAGLRWLLFAGLATAFGGLIAERFTTSARADNPELEPLRSWMAPAVLLAGVGVLGLGAKLVVDTRTTSVLWRGGSGPVLIAEFAGLLGALSLLVGRRRAWALAALLVVVGAEGWRSHAQVAAPGWGAALTGVHLVAAAIWVGALLHVARAVWLWRGHSAAVRWVLTGYMRLAVATFTVVITTGVASALLLIPLRAVFSTDYGRVLLVKLVLVTAAATLALTVRLLQRRATRLQKLPTILRAEGAALILVLAASATLVSTAPVTAAVQPGPPAPTGPVLPLGTLAGDIAVGVTASEGQLVVRLSAPRRGDLYAPQPDRHYTLSGRLGGPGADAPALAFRGCGRGCFVTVARWGDGDNILTLRAAAQDAHGATVSMLVPWPTLPGADDLARAVATLRTAGDITVYESVTSDTATPAGTPAPLDVPAEFFLSQEPYAAGTAPQAVRLSSSVGPVHLALGYPAASITVLLTLDRDGRITDESLTDPSHLVTRRFVYPDHQ